MRVAPGVAMVTAKSAASPRIPIPCPIRCAIPILGRSPADAEEEAGSGRCGIGAIRASRAAAGKLGRENERVLDGVPRAPANFEDVFVRSADSQEKTTDPQT